MTNETPSAVQHVEPLSLPAERKRFVQRLVVLFNCTYAQAIDLHIALLEIRRSGLPL